MARTRGTFRSTSSMFRAVQSAKHKRYLEETPWGVFGYTKAGTLYKSPSARARTKEDAEDVAKKLRKLNNKPFVVRGIR